MNSSPALSRTHAATHDMASSRNAGSSTLGEGGGKRLGERGWARHRGDQSGDVPVWASASRWIEPEGQACSGGSRGHEWLRALQRRA